MKEKRNRDSNSKDQNWYTRYFIRDYTNWNLSDFRWTRLFQSSNGALTHKHASVASQKQKFRCFCVKNPPCLGFSLFYVLANIQTQISDTNNPISNNYLCITQLIFVPFRNLLTVSKAHGLLLSANYVNKRFYIITVVYN